MQEVDQIRPRPLELQSQEMFLKSKETAYITLVCSTQENVMIIQDSYPVEKINSL